MQTICTFLEATCAVFSGVARCYNEDYICNEVNSSCVGKTGHYYEDGIEKEYVTYKTTACIASEDGKAFIKRQEKCAIGCTEDGAKCEPHSADNKTCTPAAAAWCEDQGYTLCALYNGDVWCYDETDKCNADAAGEWIIACDDENNIAYHYRNRLMDDGQTCVKMYGYETTCGAGSACVGGKGCRPLKKDDGTCKDEAKQYCNDEGYAHCAFVSDSAFCYDDEDVCTELNSIHIDCDGDYLWLKICRLADDSKTLLQVPVMKNECMYGCNPSTNSCRTYRIDYESLDCNEADKAACKTNSRDALCETVGGYGFCAHADDDCNESAAEETKMRCAGASLIDDNLLTYACVKTDSDTYAWTKVNTVGVCEFGCSDGRCLPWPTEEPVCTEEQKSYCAGIGADSCVYVPANWPPYKPMCYNAEDVCSGNDCPDEKTVCSNNTLRAYYSSEKSADRATTYYDAEDGKTENCAFGCNADNTACRLTSDEGDECKGQTFPVRCDGNVAVYCYNGVVTAKPCDDQSENGEAKVCFKSLNSNNFGCFSKTYFENNSCEINSEWSNCNDTWFGHAALVNHVCVSLMSHDGTIAGSGYAQTSFEYCKDASGAYTGCNSDKTACLQTKDDYGDLCDADEFTERCDGNTVVYCDDGVVTTLSCDDAAGGGEAATCYLSSTANYAKCYTANDLITEACTIPSSLTYCDDENYTHAALLTYSCAEFKTADGLKTANLYYMADGEYCVNDAETAYTVCNNDYTACSDVLEGI